MILRNSLRLLTIPERLSQVYQTRSISNDLLPRKNSKRLENPRHIPKSEGDPKLATALVDFAQGYSTPSLNT